MKPANERTRNFDSATLIEDLFGLDAAPLMSRETGYGQCDRDALAGLGRVLRRALGLALELADRRDVEIHLVTDVQAHEQQWPNADSANLGLLLTWGWLSVYRRRRNLPVARLAASRGAAVASALINPRLCASPTDAKLSSAPGIDDWEGAAADESAFPISIAERVRSSLKLDPATFSLDLAADETCRVGGQEAQARKGLEWLASDVLEQFLAMRRNSTGKVRVAEQESAIAIRRNNVQAALVATVLAAALDAHARSEIACSKMIGGPSK